MAGPEGGVIDRPGDLTTAKPPTDLWKQLHELPQAIGQGLIPPAAHRGLWSSDDLSSAEGPLGWNDSAGWLPFIEGSLPGGEQIYSDTRTISLF
jgi:hypothetical protein